MSQNPAILLKLIFSSILIILLVACGQFYCGIDDQEQSGGATVPAEQQMTPSVALCKTEARKVLKRYCGECHQKSISNVPKALHVFDLEEDVWYGHMSKSQFKGTKRRIRNADNISKEEIDIVTGCVTCLISNDCS